MDTFKTIKQISKYSSHFSKYKAIIKNRAYTWEQYSQ